MAFVSALNLVKIEQEEDPVDRLDMYEIAVNVDLVALQVPQRTIKFGA